ncbi:MAG: DHH family phosphoesterase [Clostridia bacterium]|nr:DHH family phosphoesterase [Clostridia bacterium]
MNIDNYDEVFQKLDDSESQQALSKLHKYISEWAQESKGVMKKAERDRYLVFFEHQYLKDYINKKFSLLEEVRALGEELKMPISVSIGVGASGNIHENDAYARAALDMALGRGGDQAAIKDASQYNFYGGIAKDYERSTRVKTRSFAEALKDFIANSDKVIFMGHQSLDYDAFGAALGLQRAVRTLGKEPYIVVDSSPAISKMAEEVTAIEEYRGMLISPEIARDIITMNTLLVVMDTHRPSMLPDSDLLEKTTKVVVIDHHRRSTDFISNVSLVYHEPYASSTCEMATEILQYIDNDKKITPFESKALYTGILMDTKNFSVKTGVRTFEAASYLRRYGLNTQEVRKLFNMDKDAYVNRAEIIKNSACVADKMLVSVCEEAYPDMKVISSQAADEMLNLAGIQAAFVIYPMDDETYISARSLGTINVQVIVEKLGGGGHATVAGAQVASRDTEAVLEQLENAIQEYLEENEKN